MTINTAALSRLTSKTTKIVTAGSVADVMQPAQSQHVRMTAGRNIATNTGGYIEDAPVDCWVKNPGTGSIDVEWLIKGPTYEHTIHAATIVASGIEQLDVTRVVIREDEELRVKLVSGAQAIAYTAVAEYQAKDVETARVSLPSGQAYTDIIPSPETGKMHVPLVVNGPSTGINSPNFVAGGTTGAVVDTQAILDGNTVPSPGNPGGVAPAANAIANFEDLQPPILKYGDSFQAKTTSGTGFAYTAWLSIPKPSTP